MNQRKILTVLSCFLLFVLLVGCNFQKNQKYTLTVDVEGQGTVLPNGGQYSSGEKVTLEVTPDDNWTFDHWGGTDGDQVVENQIIMNGNKTITAVFTHNDNVSIELNLSETAQGKTYYIIFDDDLDYGNGYLHKLDDAVGDSLTITDTTYFSEGTYYLYAIIDMDGDGIQNEAEWGDHYAVYGGTYNAPPDSPNATISGEGTASFELNSEVLIPSGNVVINASLPEAVEGTCWIIIAHEGVNEKEFDVDLNNTDKVELIETMEPGTYIAYILIDKNSNMMIDTGEYVGFYGSTDLVEFPEDYNAKIPENGFVVLDIPMLYVDFSGEAQMNTTWNLSEPAPGANYKLTYANQQGGEDITRTGVCPDSATLEFSETIPANLYVVSLLIDCNDNGYTDTGDYIGYYNSDSGRWPIFPSLFMTGNTYNLSTNLVFQGE